MKKIKKDDTVLIISGNDRGKKGKVLKVFPATNKIIVEGVSFVKKHQRPTQQLPQGGIMSIEAPIHVSNVKLVAPKSGIATRVGFKILKDGTKVRVCKHPDANNEEVI